MGYKGLTILLILALTSHSVLAKNYYRFKNESGSLEIKDKVTKEMELVGYDVINEKGKVVKHIDATKTLAQLEADRLRKIEERNKKIEFQKQLKHDAELLRQFSSIGDIIRNRDSQLLALEQRIRIQNSKKSLLRLQLEDQQQQAATYERLGQKVPLSISNDIIASLDQIENNQMNASFLEREKLRVEKSFEIDIIRYKDLEGVRMALRKNAKNKKENEPIIYECPDTASCNRAWQLAQIYARDNATGKIEIITNSLILTSRPVKDNDLAISFSRIPAPENKKQIVFEISCSPEEPGVEYCKTPEIRQVRSNYLVYLKDRMK